MYLECAVECPDEVQFVVDGLVFTAFYKGGPEFPLRGRFSMSYWREAGFFQVDVQLLHLIRAVLRIPCYRRRLYCKITIRMLGKGIVKID